MINLILKRFQGRLKMAQFLLTESRVGNISLSPAHSLKFSFYSIVVQTVAV